MYIKLKQCLIMNQNAEMNYKSYNEYLVTSLLKIIYRNKNIRVLLSITKN